LKKSLSYHITMFVLKLKGIKKDFSKDPIDFKKIRKEDVHHPKGSFFKRQGINRFKIADSAITEIKQGAINDKLLIFIHGGAYISGPAKHHWDTIKVLSRETKYTIWMCDYPKAPENQIKNISTNIDLVYKSALESYSSDKITLIGDSVGGALITTLTQRLIKNNIATPDHIILISPVMNANLSNPQVLEVEKVDPMLSKAGVQSAKSMCAGELSLDHELISPINGNFNDFPKTSMFVAEHDITFPDQLLSVEKMKAAGTELELIVGKEMPHIWPFLPVMEEAKSALKKIIAILNN